MQGRPYLLGALVLFIATCATLSASSRVHASSRSNVQLSKPGTAFTELRRMTATRAGKMSLSDSVQNRLNDFATRVISSARSSAVDVRSSRARAGQEKGAIAVSSGSAQLRDTHCFSGDSIAQTCNDNTCSSAFDGLASENPALTAAEWKNLYCTRTDGNNPGSQYCLDLLAEANAGGTNSASALSLYCGPCGPTLITLADQQGQSIEEQIGLPLNVACMKDPADGKYCADKMDSLLAPLTSDTEVDMSDPAALEPQLQVLCSPCGRMLLTVISALFEFVGDQNEVGQPEEVQEEAGGGGNATEAVEAGTVSASEDQNQPAGADIPEDITRLFISLSDLICLRDNDGQFCYTDSVVSSWGETYLAGDPNMENDPTLAEEAAAKFCENTCLTLMIPALAAVDETLESYQSIYTAGCYKDAGLYCLAKFAANRDAFELAACDASASSCSSDCQDEVEAAGSSMGCCLTEAMTLAPEGDMTAAKTCSDLPARCDGGGDVKLKIGIPNLKRAWLQANWQQESVQTAVASDVGRTVRQARELISISEVGAGSGAGSVITVAIAVQSETQAETVLNILQGVSRRRAGTTWELSSLSAEVPSTAFVNPAEPLSATVDDSSVEASGVASQFIIEPSTAAPRRFGAGRGVWVLVGLAGLLSLICTVSAGV
mmetsp:Transcript_61542/g.144771  ORF Transcript_61542/g.144771 Transcript_61542/m.144771 type:complete len:661 (-) Transcript_61542:554-2536(-)